jgi:hypothetical protein
MNPNHENLWVAKASTKDSTNKSLALDPNQRMVEEAVLAIALHLHELLSLFETTACLTLALSASDRNARLARGINESGFIAPDFGKAYVGLYFETLVISLDVTGKQLKQKWEFLEPYVRSRMVQYWIQERTPYSNWEFSWHHAKAPKPANGILTARQINFPLLKIEKNKEVGKTP